MPKYKFWQITGTNFWESFEPLLIRRKIWAPKWLLIGSWKFQKIYNFVFWGYLSKNAGDCIALPSCSGGSCFRRIAARKNKRIWSRAYSSGCIGFGVRIRRSVKLVKRRNIHPWKMIFIASIRIYSKNHWSAISSILNNWHCRIPSSMNQRQNRGPFRP